MIVKHEELVTVEQANSIKREVTLLNNRFLKTTYKQCDDSTYKTITISICNSPMLEDKIKACKILKEYGDNLRVRLFNKEV